jgi:peptidoglycan LD-endopeptidase LytH
MHQSVSGRYSEMSRRMKNAKRALARVVAVAFGCGTIVPVIWMLFGPHPFDVIWRKLRPDSPHQRYARSLADGRVADPALATAWLAAANKAVQQPVTLTAPFIEEALIDPAHPMSLGYAVTLKRGQTLVVQVTVATDTRSQVFVDLFEPNATRDAHQRPVASARRDDTALSHEAGESGVYVLRIQPELFRGGHIRVTCRSAPSLHFPAAGGGAHSIQSRFGVDRDGGRRRHEGVDIFAPRGTPVLAASDGFVTNVGENTLGGRVVWVWDIPRGARLYYAHLQDQLVRQGAFVRAGDTLGTVGNTGNATTTAPHLHFGIYARGEGAIDPDGFIRPVSETADNPVVTASTLGDWGRTRRAVALRASPSGAAPVVDTVPRAAEIRVEGGLGSWIRTSTGDHMSVFLQARDLDLRRFDHAQ